MKALISAFALCLISSVSLASTAQEKLNESVDDLMGTIRNLRYVMVQTSLRTGVPNREQVCWAMRPILLRTDKLEKVVKDNFPAYAVEQNAAIQIQKDAKSAKSFCDSTMDVSADQRLYTFSDFDRKIEQIGNLALSLKK